MSLGTQGDCLIEAHGLCYRYPGGQPALDGVDLSVAPGQFVVALGANGSGKTTLLKIILRLIRPDAGRVTLAGTPLADWPERELYRRLGMVFQSPADQLFAPTVEQDVAFGPRNLDLDETEVSRRVADALDRVDASDLRHRPVHQLSFGQQRRVCLAGVLAMSPDVLVLDEPTAGLDPQAEARMIDLLLGLNRQGVTMIVATHSVDLLAVHADQAVVLHRGRAVRTGPPAEVFADPDTVAAAGLRLPLIAQLFSGFTEHDDLPLTLEQGRRLLTTGKCKMQNEK